LRRACAALLVVGLAACGPPPRAPLAPGEDYVAPSLRGREVSAEEGRRLEGAWRDILAGRAREAEATYRKALLAHPGLIAAETGLAYARLREGRAREAGEGFASVLVRRPEDLSALIGGASAAMRQGNPDGALSLYRQAQAAHPGDPIVRRRLPEVKLQVTERHVAAARAAAGAGNADRATEEYRAALDAAPELATLRLELAELLVRRGDTAAAAAVLTQDPEGDRQVLLRLGELLGEQLDYPGALEAYRRILTRDPRDVEAQRRALETREALDLSAMPEEFQRIPSATRITRADLAALVSVRITALGRAKPADPEVAVDIAGSWAREHILKALSFDILPVYPNHTFQPGATVRRGDLARAVARVLDLLRWPTSSPPAISDMTRSNLLYDSASRTVSAGLMDLTASGSFEPWRPVSGREALDVIEALARLVGP
jgi:tetratricopeptide (TPR) repeat protein